MLKKKIMAISNETKESQRKKLPRRVYQDKRGQKKEKKRKKKKKFNHKKR
jgi:hypothetical protein